MSDAQRATGREVYEQIRQEILTCKLAPGAMLDAEDLGRRFATRGPSPVREAMSRLYDDALVDAPAPRERKYRVSRISIKDAQDILALRSLLEQDCARRTATVADDDELYGLDRFRQLDDSASYIEWRSYNRQFHLTIAALSGNLRLASMTREIVDECNRVLFILVGEDESLRRRAVADHSGIIDALQAHDPQAAADCMRDHIESTIDRLSAAAAHPAMVA